MDSNNNNTSERGEACILVNLDMGSGCSYCLNLSTDVFTKLQSRLFMYPVVIALYCACNG